VYRLRFFPVFFTFSIIMEQLRTAYIFSGHLRTFEPNWFKFNSNSDIYIHTYDRIGYWSATDSVNMNTDLVTVDSIHQLFGTYAQYIRHIVIETDNSKLPIIHKFANLMESNKVHYARPFNFISMHMKRLSALESFFEQTDIHHRHYDLVFLFRPDFPFYHYDLIEPSLISNGLIYIEGDHNYNNHLDWFSDFFIIANMEQLSYLKLNYIDSFHRYISDYKGQFDPHSYFHFLITTYFKYKFISCGGNRTLMNTPNGYCNP
jgi:hypothetical protein